MKSHTLGKIIFWLTKMEFNPHFDAEAWKHENNAYWKGYNQAEEENSIEPLLTDKQWDYVWFTVFMILLGIVIWLTGLVIIRAIT